MNEEIQNIVVFAIILAAVIWSVHRIFSKKGGCSCGEKNDVCCHCLKNQSCGRMAKK